MRILFFSHYFPPEVNAPANRTFEHAREWVRAGNEVHVVTCVPSHPRGVPFAGYRRRWYRCEEIEGIHVHRVWTYLAANSGVVRRSLSYLSFVPTAVWRALRLGRFDVVAATSPQFFCAVAGWLAAGLKRTPWVFELRDLWPESVAAVGAIRTTAAVRMLERLELRMYRSAARVVCVTRAFVENLAGRGIPREKLAFVPNGVEPAAWRGADGGTIRERFGLDGRVVASYVGTVGMAHGIGTVIEAARRLRAEAPEVHLLVVGDGAEKDRLAAAAAEQGLQNLTFAGLLPRAEMPAVLAASDIALVLLRRRDLFLTVLPSKLFEAMAAARPVVLGVGGEARATLERAGAGIAVTPEDADELCAAIVRLARDPAAARALGEAGARFVAAEFDRAGWARRMAAVLAEVAAGRPAGVAVAEGEGAA